MRRIAAVVGALAIVLGLATWNLGLRPFGDGELIDGRVVGTLVECSSADWIGDQVETILEVWPDGHPPIRQICEHRPPSNEPISLGHPRYVVVHLEDGSRVARRFTGVGCAVDQAGTPQACARYDPSMAADPATGS